MNREANLRTIFDKTRGVCHFCGDSVVFEKYDLRGELGSWNIDHVNQKSKGGSKNAENCLPACASCNRLRWAYRGDRLRELLSLGQIADGEIRKNSLLGKQIKSLRARRVEQTLKRRKPKRLGNSS